MSKEIIVERGTKTVYREGSKIVKQFKAGYPKSAVIKEAFNHALAEESGLNVPALLEVKNTGEGWALVIEAVEGKTMAQLMAEQPENLEALMTQFVEIQSDVHRRTCKQMGRLKDKLNAQISSLRDELDASTRYELHVRLENMKPHTKITHGDFNPTNVLIGEDGKVYMGGCKMPLKYVAEMFCDRIAACKIYQGEQYTDASAYDYYERSRGHILIHPETGELIGEMLRVLKEEGEDAAFSYVRGLLREEKQKSTK